MPANTAKTDVVWSVITQFLLGKTKSSLAKEFGISYHQVCRILEGRHVQIKEGDKHGN